MSSTPEERLLTEEELYDDAGLVLGDCNSYSKFEPDSYGGQWILWCAKHNRFYSEDVGCCWYLLALPAQDTKSYAAGVADTEAKYEAKFKALVDAVVDHCYEELHGVRSRDMRRKALNQLGI